MSRTLALDCASLRDTADLPSTFGFDAALEGFIDAALRFSSYERLVLFHPPGWAPQRRDALRARARAGADVRLASAHEIPRYVQQREISVWFQPDTRTEPVNYRSVFGGAVFPFTTPIYIAWGPQLLRTQYLWLLLDGLAECDSFVCTTRSVQAVVRETLAYMIDEMREWSGAELRYRGRLDVLPLGVDTDRFAPRPKALLRADLGWPADAFVLLWVGRFSAVDKTDLLPALRMFRRLVDANPHRTLRFVLAGNDRSDIPFVPAISQFAHDLGLGDHVQILDNIRAFDDTAVDIRPALFAAADVFTSPVDNLQETFGLAVVEAMACGTPQVVSDWDGYKDTTVHGVTGYRIPTYWTHCDADPGVDAGIGGFGYQGHLWAQSVAIDLPEYQAAVQRLLDDPSLAAEMGARSRQRAVEVFGWAAVVRAYEALWDELSAIAASLSPAGVRYPPFSQATLCRRFREFPTAMLEGHEWMTVSREGRRLVEGAEPFPWHSPHERALIDVEEMLAMLASAEHSPGSLDDLADRFSRGDPDRRAAGLRAVMWGFKHGFLECAVSRAPDVSPGFDTMSRRPALVRT